MLAHCMLDLVLTGARSVMYHRPLLSRFIVRAFKPEALYRCPYIHTSSLWRSNWKRSQEYLYVV